MVDRATEGIITIRDLQLQLVVGAYQWERRRRQTVCLTVELRTDCSAAIASDALDDALDYAALTDRITKAAQDSSFILVEALAAYILDLVLADERVSAARIHLRKPSALPNAAGVEIELRSTSW